MNKVRKLKKRSAYVIGLALALVFSYIYKDNATESTGLLGKVPYAQADIPPPPTDSSPTDSSPTDSSPTDSSPTDSSPTDSSPTDSSPTDSSPTDSSPTDSSPTDSAPDASSDASSDGGGSDGCFVAGTFVTLFNGTKLAIEKIKPGMVVQGLNKSSYVVAGLISHDGKDAFLHDFKNEPLKVITLSNGETIKTVDGHPVMVNNGDGFVWSNISALKEGSLVKHYDLDEIYVTKIETVIGLTPILYNLELIVAPNEERSYFANGVLVRDTQFIGYSISRWLAPPVATKYFDRV